LINKINDATTIVLIFEEASSLWSFIHHHGYGAKSEKLKTGFKSGFIRLSQKADNQQSC